MARAATTSDVFNAVAEPRRRQILAMLAQGERSVNQIATSLHMQQPQASKHLRILKMVGLVSTRGEAQRRVYTLNADRLKPIHDWVMSFEKFWRASYDRLDDYLEELQRKDGTNARRKQ